MIRRTKMQREERKKIKKSLKKFNKRYLKMIDSLDTLDLRGDELYRFANWFFDNRELLLQGDRHLEQMYDLRWIDYNLNRKILTIKIQSTLPPYKKITMKIRFEDTKIQNINRHDSYYQNGKLHEFQEKIPVYLLEYKVQSDSYVLLKIVISHFVKKYYSIFREDR